MGSSLIQVLWMSNAIKEVFLFREEVYVVPSLALIRFLSETEPFVWIKIGNNLAKLDEILNRIQSFNTEDENENRKMKDAVCEYLKEVEKIRKMSIPELLSDLIVFLPALAGMSVAERDYIQEGFVPSVADSFFAWEDWLELLKQKTVLSVSNREGKRFVQLLCVIEEYTDLLHGLYNEAKTLSNHFYSVFEGSAEEIESHDWNREYQILSYQAKPYSVEPNNASMIERLNKKHSAKLKKKTVVFSTTSLTTLLKLELQSIRDYGLKLKKCEFCGKYYWSNNSKSVYCKFSQDKYDGRICQEIAPEIKYLEQSKMRPEFRSSCAKYNRWISRICEEDPARKLEYILEIEELMENQGKGFIEITVEKQKESGEKISLTEEISLTDVYKEAREIHKKWQSQANEALGKYERGEMTEDSCREALTLPSIEKRSPKLAKMRADLRERKGNRAIG